ncbi:hypothetical protein K431DRAFT_243506 [Polychaeton citri CBS 116435]|uniref:F-box domain-containing protein n=1 Tax=Polychaeton citri CBS 116435 TaxID=1314669 RepID=A0A9P4UP34_9PEZI|nr:hypothetical protein K431DRAFT_243506 [Polychaeton citri CBS 116435]
MTPPPSSQLPGPLKANSQRTPTPPTSHMSTPPPTIDFGMLQAGRPVLAAEVVMTTEQLSSASPDELRVKVDELQAAVSEARMSAAHYKLQYNMLSQESRATLDRMAVEARMAQFESDVIYSAEQAKVASSPAQHSPIKLREEGIIPVEKGLYQRILKELNYLRDANWALRDDLERKQHIIFQQESEVTTLSEKVAMLRDRVRSYRDHRANSVARVESTPKSAYNTPHRARAFTQYGGHGQSEQPFAALLQASEMASQQQARNYSTRKGHSRNTHSMSSLPVTPQQHRKQANATYTTPHRQQAHRAALKIPSTAPVNRSVAYRTPDVYPPPIYPVTQPPLPGGAHQSDGTVSASEHAENDSEAETDIIDPSNDDPIPESRASMTASHMLRSSQEEQRSTKRSSREEPGTTSIEPSGSPIRATSRPSVSNISSMRQTKLFGAVRKSNINRVGEARQLRFLPTQATSLQKRAIARVEEQSDLSSSDACPLTPQKRRKTANKESAVLTQPCHVMVTRGKSRDAACKAVFNTHELTLMILCHLPMQQLLRARHVCKSFYSFIVYDTHLQRQLFLLPEPQKTIWAYDTRLISVRAYTYTSDDHHDPTWINNQRKTIPGKVNPLLFFKDASHEHVPGIKNNVFTMMKWCDTVRFLQRPSLQPTVTATSLIHRMFICQPPCTEVEFKWFFYCGKPRRAPSVGSSEWKYLRIRVWNENGVRFGDLVKGFMEETRKEKMFDGADPENFYLRKAPCVVWMKGVCFPSKDEWNEVSCGIWDVRNGAQKGDAAV